MGYLVGLGGNFLCMVACVLAKRAAPAALVTPQQV